jgi:hypothetical protein
MIGTQNSLICFLGGGEGGVVLIFFLNVRVSLPPTPPHPTQTRLKFLFQVLAIFVRGERGHGGHACRRQASVPSFFHKSLRQKYLVYLEVTFYKQNVSLGKRDRSFNFGLKEQFKKKTI